ncbi:clan AA aspartic protease [Mucilaginibacter achroorhodeus]|uniref:Clan AA aspartic protease n=1 Tax=Mucilaginibacter achroorhodeus TaxID=2599294 RepID=A0A563U9D7_9SPHI|nr:retropepsin-like aspartic protease [Mucilaginibacter achroorhodeus]TWR27987.1 clan AA aspartic protease [Mucilaginibacter achroorhodeus]
MPFISSTIPLQIINLHDDGFHPLLDITVFGKPFKAVLDTGASRTAFDREVLTAANAEADIIASERLSTGLGTTTMESATAVIKKLYISDFLIPEIEVAVLDLSTINYAYREMGHPEILGVIGSDIMMKYKGVVDFGRKKLTLKQKAPL